jgi:YesN/AraC family two-component response regulator
VIKVFLVEDESIVREGLRDNMPWQQQGYQFVGEASDGEMALPMIRKLKPDVLFTDIKMPFMDGLALSRIVSQEFPDMKIIILSGYDDFEYARSAIRVGVEQYLLKPITKSTMTKVLSELRVKIEAQRQQSSYQDQYQDEMREYEKYSRRIFFEKLFEGHMSVQEIYEEAGRLGLEMDAPCYNLIFVSLQEKRNQENRRQESREFARKQDELLRFLLRYPEHTVFRWNISTYGVLLQGETAQMEEITARCMENIKRICETSELEFDWYAAAGAPVERLSSLPECYSRTNHIFSYRFMMPSVHILTEDLLKGMMPEREENTIGGVDSAKVDPEIIKEFLMTGRGDEIQDFAQSYLQSVQEALRSKLFRDYLTLSIRFTTIAYVESLGCSQSEFLEALGGDRAQEAGMGAEEIPYYLQEMLTQALLIRDRESDNQGKKILKKALEYIEENYTQESLSLNSVAGAVNVSANYFSALFSQEMQSTFVEYVTQKRMEKAKKLLRQSEKHSGEIALEVGYKDPHYFSFVFKKTQGYTPREYRSRYLS